MANEWTYHGNGVASKMHADRDRQGNRRERRYYYARYSYRGKRYTQQAGTTEGKALALACKIEQDRKDARRAGVEWVPPSIRVKQRQSAAEAKSSAWHSEQCGGVPYHQSVYRKHQ